MYLVSKKSPVKIIFKELWNDHLRAEIRREVINVQSDEYHGAIVESLIVHDEGIFTNDDIKLEVDFPDNKSLCNISCVMHLSGAHWLIMPLDVTAGAEFIVEAESFVWESDEDSALNFDPSPDLKNRINKFLTDAINEQDCLADYSDEDYLHAKSIEADNLNDV
jgi:hypothetical protein